MVDQSFPEGLGGTNPLVVYSYIFDDEGRRVAVKVMVKGDRPVVMRPGDSLTIRYEAVETCEPVRVDQTWAVDG